MLHQNGNIKLILDKIKRNNEVLKQYDIPQLEKENEKLHKELAILMFNYK